MGVALGTVMRGAWTDGVVGGRVGACAGDLGDKGRDLG